MTLVTHSSTPLPQSGASARPLSDERTAGARPIATYSGTKDFLETEKVQEDTPDHISFADILDIVNPLQHLPIVGHIYRAITGDTIKPGAQIIGGALFGGGLGLLGASVNVAIDETLKEERQGRAGSASQNGQTIADRSFGPEKLDHNITADQVKSRAKEMQEGAHTYRMMAMRDSERMAGSVPVYA